MKVFLLIHTSLDKGFAALATEDGIIAAEESENPKEHGVFLHQSIAGLMKKNNIRPAGISAIGVTAGPGSYTGIRVGLSAAKGLGYAWRKPLVACSNLKALATTAIGRIKNFNTVCVSLIHARQNEYYTGFYNAAGEEVRPDSLMVFDGDMPAFLSDRQNVFAGIDLQKFTAATGLKNVSEIDKIDLNIFGKIIIKMFNDGKITDAGNAVPIYLKDVYIAPKSR